MGPLPDVEPELVSAREVLKELGQLEGFVRDKKRVMRCRGCLPGSNESEYDFEHPAVRGSFTAKGKAEVLLQAGGTCGVEGRSWGCFVVVGDTPEGRDVIRVRSGKYGSQQLHAYRIEGERDLAVGLFWGGQSYGAWTAAFVVDLVDEEQEAVTLVSAGQFAACGDGGITDAQSAGNIDKVVSKDLDGDGTPEIVVSGRYGERIVLDRMRGCAHPPKPVLAPFSFVFRRAAGAFQADEKAAKAGANKVNLQLLGVPLYQRPR